MHTNIALAISNRSFVKFPQDAVAGTLVSGMGRNFVSANAASPLLTTPMVAFETTTNANNATDADATALLSLHFPLSSFASHRGFPPPPPLSTSHRRSAFPILLLFSLANATKRPPALLREEEAKTTRPGGGARGEEDDIKKEGALRFFFVNFFLFYERERNKKSETLNSRFSILSIFAFAGSFFTRTRFGST